MAKLPAIEKLGRTHSLKSTRELGTQTRWLHVAVCLMRSSDDKHLKGVDLAAFNILHYGDWKNDILNHIKFSLWRISIALDLSHALSAAFR